MPIKATVIERKFSYNGMVIPDPNPNASLDDVVKLLSATYPEFGSAKVDPVATINNEGGSRVETFAIKAAAGTKG